MRALAGRNVKTKRFWSQVLGQAAKDAEKLDSDFGRQAATMIRRVLIMKPLLDPGTKNWPGRGGEVGARPPFSAYPLFRTYGYTIQTQR